MRWAEVRWVELRSSEDHRHAARVATGLMVPGLVLVTTGIPELILYAVLGSFTGMYGRQESRSARLHHQFHGAGMLVTGVVLGTALREQQWPGISLVAAVTVFATIGSLVTDRLRLRPGGPFFGIFALGASATVPPGGPSVWLGPAICAGTALFCLFIGRAVSLLTHRRPLRSCGTPRCRQRSEGGGRSG